MTSYNVNVSCWGKAQYLTWTAASKVVRRQYGKVRRSEAEDAGVYRCRICRKWHVGGGKERD
jgi:hypothetical protein